MVDTTFFEKLKVIFNVLKENSLISLTLLLLTIIILDLLYGRNSKKIKVLYGIIIILTLCFIIFTYYKPFLNIFDIYITYIFKIAYFPSIIEYTSMILITIFLQIISFIKNNKLLKYLNIWIGIIIETLFIINLITMDNITVDLNKLTSIYENTILLSIFQLSGIIFILWIILNIIIYIISIILCKRIEIPKLNENYY